MATQFQYFTNYSLDIANFTTTPKHENRFTYLTLEAILFFLGLAGIISNFMIAYAIYRLKLYEKCRGFILFVLLFYSTVYLVLSPVDRYLAKHLSNKLIVYSSEMCFVYEIANCSLSLVSYLHVMLCMDWILYNFLNNIYLFYERKYLIIEVLLLSICFLISFYSTLSCIEEFDTFTAHYCFYFYLLAILAGSLNVIRLICNTKRGVNMSADYTLVVPLIFAIFWFPHFMVDTIRNYFNYFKFEDYVIFLICVAQQSSSIINIVYLSKYVYGFEEVFLNIIRCNTEIN